MLKGIKQQIIIYLYLFVELNFINTIIIITLFSLFWARIFIIFNLNTLFRINRKYLKFHHYYNSNIKKTNKKYNKKYLLLKNKIIENFYDKKDLKWKLIWYKWISSIQTRMEWIYFDKSEIDEDLNINKFTNLHKILYLLNPHFISFCFHVFNIGKFLSDLIRS